MSEDNCKRPADQRNSGPLKKFKAGIADLELLNCEICFELPRAEVYQCSKGHSVCSKCFVNLKKCPTCDVPYLAADGQGTEKIRNYFAEKILSTVRFDCSWREHGCDKGGLTGQQVTEHQEQCSFNPNPIKLCDMLFKGTCAYQVSREILRNPGLEIPADLLNHLRDAHDWFANNEETKLSGTISISSISQRSVEAISKNEVSYTHSNFIRLVDNTSRNPIGLFMIWSYNYLLLSEVKQISWFLVRITDEPKSCSVRVKFSLKGRTAPGDDGVLVCKTSWNGEIMSLNEFSKFRKTLYKERKKFQFAIPLSHLQDQYLNADGGLDLQFVFTVTPHANRETADSSSNSTI